MESDALEPFMIAQHFPGLFWGMAIGYGLHCLALIVCLTYLIRSKLYIYAKCQQSSFFFQLGGMRRGGTEEKQEVRGRRRGDSVIAELKDSNMWKNIPICGKIFQYVEKYSNMWNIFKRLNPSPVEW